MNVLQTLMAEVGIVGFGIVPPCAIRSSWLPLQGALGWLWTLVAGLAIYALAAAMLRHPELAQVRSLVMGRLRRNRGG